MRRSRGSFYVDTNLRPSEGLRGVGKGIVAPILNHFRHYIMPRANEPSARC